MYEPQKELFYRFGGWFNNLLKTKAQNENLDLSNATITHFPGLAGKQPFLHYCVQTEYR